MRRAAVIFALAAVLAGCGGGGGGGGSSSSDASKVVPGDALGFVAIDTDLSSTQLQNAASIVDKFPIKDKAIQAIAKSVNDAGASFDAVKSSIGSEVDVAVLTVAGKPVPVGFAKPSDEQTFEQQLQKGSSPPKIEQISGWTVFADTQAALDAVKNRTDSLADQQPYKDALASVPGDAVARFYVAPAALDELKSATPGASSLTLPTTKIAWISGALTADGGAFKLEAHAKGIGASASQVDSPLVKQIPSGVLVALSVVGAGQLQDASKQAFQQAQQRIGIDLEGLASALGDETIAYVKQGFPIPEVTLASRSGDAQRGLAAVNGLLQKIASGSKHSTVTAPGGETLDKYDLGPVSVYVGRTGDEIVVSDSEDAIGELTGSGAKLVDDSAFKDAKSAAGLPDASEGFFYVDVKDTVPSVEGLAQLGNVKIPPAVDANLKPLKTLLVYGAHDGDLQTFVAYLSTS